ncbi:MAG: hypothetical protein ACOCUL_02660, partial [Bacteroidota bacterium]
MKKLFTLFFLIVSCSPLLKSQDIIITKDLPDVFHICLNNSKRLVLEAKDTTYNDSLVFQWEFKTRSSSMWVSYSAISDSFPELSGIKD